VLEDLNVQDLIQKSENKKRRRLRLYDFSFSEIRAVLEWEFRKRGKLVLPVPAYNSSRKCFLCGEINENFERIFNCPYCGFAIDRDLNACFKKRWEPPVVAWKASPTTSSSLSWVEGARGSGDSGSSTKRGSSQFA
jgi:Transposase and inactivated derivatives